MRTTTGTSITGWGVWHPSSVLTNAELCVAFNEFVRRDNASHAAEIAAGTRTALKESTPEFIEKASGIKRRYVEDKTGLMDPERLCPNIADRGEDQLSVQAEYATTVGKLALAMAGRAGEDVDLVVLGASNLQRMYPAIAIEVQDALGARGYGLDMSLGCSAATGAAITACNAVRSGQSQCALVVVPELTTGHMNWRDRDSHFIFGDVATAIIVERAEDAEGGWDILGTRLKTVFSNNIRNNFGFLNRAAPDGVGQADKLFVQEGRKVFREVVPMVSEMIVDHAAGLGLDTTRLKRMWLHQANINMNEMIGRKVLGRDPAPEENVIILDEYANTSSAGSIIAFHLHSQDLAAGDLGLICSFGAGYSAGTVFVQKRG